MADIGEGTVAYPEKAQHGSEPHNAYMEAGVCTTPNGLVAKLEPNETN